MAFDRSLLKVLDAQPWRYTTQPTYDADGNMTDPGVKQTLDGVFVLCSPDLVSMFKDGLTAAQKTTIDGYVFNVTADQAGDWHVPVWAGEASAVYLRIPATLWSDPATPPPAKVKAIFKQLWQEAQS